MGFFSDLKEDLSQAVNELIPDGGETAKETTGTQAEDAVSLEGMLQNHDSVQLPEEEPDAAETSGQEAEDTTVAEENGASLETETQEDDSAAKEDMTAENTAADATDAGEWNLDGLLKNALTDEEAADKGENKGEGRTMEFNSNRQAADETSIISAGMSITGDIISEGSLDIIGRVNGNIDVMGKLNITGHITGNSKAAEIFAEGAKINGEIVSEGPVKVGASTVIVGNIVATSAAIAGAVKGDIDVRGPVILDASAIVMGNIKSKSVQINNGAVIEGMCSQCYADVSPSSFFENYKIETKKDKSK